MLLVLGTTNSFIPYRLATLAPIPASPLPKMWHVYYPSGDVEQLGWVYLNCEIFVEGFSLTANLMLLDIVEFDMILGMDFLENHQAIFVVTAKRCCLEVLGCQNIIFMETRGLQCLVSLRR